MQLTQTRRESGAPTSISLRCARISALKSLMTAGSSSRRPFSQSTAVVSNINQDSPEVGEHARWAHAGEATHRRAHTQAHAQTGTHPRREGKRRGWRTCGRTQAHRDINLVRLQQDRRSTARDALFQRKKAFDPPFGALCGREVSQYSPHPEFRPLFPISRLRWSESIPTEAGRSVVEKHAAQTHQQTCAWFRQQSLQPFPWLRPWSCERCKDP